MSISAVTPFNQFGSKTNFKQQVNNGQNNQAAQTNPVEADKKTNSKTAPIVSSAIALASLGVAGYSMAKNHKSLKTISELKGSIETLTQSLERKTSTIEENVRGLGDTINTVKSSSESVANEVRGAVNDVRNTLGRETGALRGEIDSVRGRI